MENVVQKIYQQWPWKLSVKRFIIYHGNHHNLCIQGIFSIAYPHPVGTSTNPDIFQEYQKILIGFYNGGLWENVLYGENGYSSKFLK